MRGFLLIAASLCAMSVANADAPPSYGVCAACHTSDGSHGLGPTMKGVYGRKAGSLGGFAFSRAMRNSGVVWDEKSLDAYLADPQKAMPGNTMPFGGISDPKQRAELVDYLKTLK